MTGPPSSEWTGRDWGVSLSSERCVRECAHLMSEAEIRSRAPYQSRTGRVVHDGTPRQFCIASRTLCCRVDARNEESRMSVVRARVLPVCLAAAALKARKWVVVALGVAFGAAAGRGGGKGFCSR